MAEKNGLAQLLDKVAEGLSKAKKNVAVGEDVANILPKPVSQEIGDGVIVWTWMVPGDITVESVLATRNNNQSKLEKGEYVVGVKLPESENSTYALHGDTAKDLGQAILSAWNWKNIWRVHAGDYLLDVLSFEPEPPVEVEGFADVVPPAIAPEIIDADDYPVSNVQG